MLRIALLAVWLFLPAIALSGTMDSGPAAPPPRFEGKVTSADSRNALDGWAPHVDRAGYAWDGVSPKLLDAMVAAGLLAAAAETGRAYVYPGLPYWGGPPHWYPHPDW